MVSARPPARRPLRLLVTSLASALAAAVLTGCVLNQPPNAAEVKDLALYGLQPPPQWATGSARAGAALDDWLAGFNDDELTKAVYEALNHNADLSVAAARVLLARSLDKVSSVARPRLRPASSAPSTFTSNQLSMERDTNW